MRRWQDKLTPAGLQCLEEYRLRQKAIAAAPKTKPVNVVDMVVSKLEAASSPQAETDGRISEMTSVDPSVAKFAMEVETQLREAFLKDVPAVIDIAKFISGILEEGGPQAREGISFVLAVAIHSCWGAFLDVRKRHFGNAKLTQPQSLWVFGTALSNVGSLLRTGDPTPTTKGRANPELIDLIREIRKHEQKRLSYRELKEAINYAGLHCPDEESLRLFVYRAQKRGWL